MINDDNFTKENINEYNPNWPQIPNHLDRMLILGRSGSGKTNALLNLIKQQDDDDYKIFMLRIQMRQNINILLKNVKTVVLKV